MKKIVSTLIVLAILFSACDRSNPEVYFLDQKIKTENKIEKLLEDSNLDEIGIDQEGKILLRKFYQERKFKPVWSDKKKLSNRGHNVYKLLQGPIAFGLPAKRYSDLKWSKKYHLKNEIIISCMLSRMHFDLKHGLMDSARSGLKPLAYDDFSTFESLFDLPNQSDKIAERIIGWGPEDTTYQSLAKALYAFATTHPLNDEKIQVPTQKKDSLGSVTQAKKALQSKGYLGKDTFSDEDYFAALKEFQKTNAQKPDAVVGENTAHALEETNIHRCKRIALAMEKWRWKEKFPRRFAWVNIPEFKLRYFDNDSLKSENNVVVGKFENQTPEFTAKVRSIVAFPYWNVPYSITSKEMLPDVKRDPNYFTRNQMKLFRKGEEVDPSTVNWKAIKEKTFPYSVRQEPGEHNSLGIVKFEFNNPYGVYVHDTPSKSLFKTTVRSYSHGCVRCENPVDLAKLMLLRDENTMIPDSLDSIMSRRVNYPIHLKKNFPIYFDYITVIPAKSEIAVLFLKDIYLKDDHYLKILF